MPLPWGRRSSHLHTMKHRQAKRHAISRTELAVWITAPGTVLVPSGQPRAWPDLRPVLASSKCHTEPNQSRKFSSLSAHKLCLQTGTEPGRVTTQETQSLIPSTVPLERIPLAAHAYIAEQGLNLVPIYTERDVAESGGDLHGWKQEGTLASVSSQTDRKQEGCTAFTSLS